MGKRIDGLTLLKLGGSLITEKDRPLTTNDRNIENIAHQLSTRKNSSNQPLVLVHGGGSFGHFYAKKFHLSQESSTNSSLEGLTRTSAAMLELDSYLLGQFADHGVFCYTLSTSDLLSESNVAISEPGDRKLRLLIEHDLIPMSFGNVSYTERGARIISGDSIIIALAKFYRAQKVIFAMDVDGIFPTSDMNTPIIPELFETTSIESTIRKYDVTGGIRSKIETGFKLSRLGVDVYYVNGGKEGRIASLLSGKTDGVLATRIRSNIA